MEERVAKFRTTFQEIGSEISKMIVGQEELIRFVLFGLFSGGNILLEGVPGLGKTVLVKSLSKVLDLEFSRIQFTPDLMPSDIIGTNVIVQGEGDKQLFEFQKGPLFAQIVLADEINRATPKTQSALLEAMQEHQVTVMGKTYKLVEPFIVLATQNPIEMEGTYPLPEAQVDRFFFKLDVFFPSVEELVLISKRTTSQEEVDLKKVADGQTLLTYRSLIREVPVAEGVLEYAARIVLATHPEIENSHPLSKKYIKYGSSPRGMQVLILGAKINALLSGRYNVAIDDIKAVAKPALRHRMILSFEGEAEGIKPDTIIEEILTI
ncbi:MAG: MoxR family ATPase [Candidatus Coatesbacteria bacterium]|nr:MoxR family ATPase [Candidatus Coatesbacteria bacterium]